MPAFTVEEGLVGWLDVTAGVSGDMLLGAFVDAGAEVEHLQRQIDLVIPGTVRLDVTEVSRAGMRATRVDVCPLVQDHEHRARTDIRTRLLEAELRQPVKELALGTFGRLAAVEGHIHGVPEGDVTFHEVGAWDSIADVVGTCAAVVEQVMDVTSTLGVRQAVVQRRQGYAPGRPDHSRDTGIDDVAAAAATLERPIRDLLSAAVAAAASIGLTRGQRVPAALRPTSGREQRPGPPSEHRAVCQPALTPAVR